MYVPHLHVTLYFIFFEPAVLVVFVDVLVSATADEADAYMFHRCFFLFFFVFFRSRQNTRQPFSGTAERIFMKLLPNDSWENGVSNVIPKLGLDPQIILWG